MPILQSDTALKLELGQHRYQPVGSRPLPEFVQVLQTQLLQFQLDWLAAMPHLDWLAVMPEQSQAETAQQSTGSSDCC